MQIIYSSRKYPLSQDKAKSSDTRQKTDQKVAQLQKEQAKYVVEGEKIREQIAKVELQIKNEKKQQSSSSKKESSKANASSNSSPGHPKSGSSPQNNALAGMTLEERKWAGYDFSDGENTSSFRKWKWLWKLVSDPKTASLIIFVLAVILSLFFPMGSGRRN